MGRSFALGALVLLLSLPTPSFGGGVPLVLPPNLGRHSIAAGLDCATCELLVGIAQEAALNSTFMSELVSVLDAGCAAAFPGANNSVSAALCEALARDVTSLFPWVEKQLETLAWDVPQGFCSVFVPVCTAPCCGTPSAPEQIHLSLPGAGGAAPSWSTGMRVTWVTLNVTNTSTVQFGPASGDPDAPLPSAAAGTWRTYTFGGWMGTIHEALMGGLVPGGTYSYRVGDEAGGWSDVYNFTALPADVGSAARPLRIANIGDMAYDNTSDLTVATLTALVVAGEIDIVLHPGDISYADGFQPHWDAYLNKVQGIAARVPYMVAPGNHEFWANFTAYKARFGMPSAANFENMYSSFDVGNTHVIMFDTETIIDTADIDRVQLDWLTGDLAAVNKTATPWVVAAGHRPLYCSDSDKTQCGTFASILRSQAEELFLASKVDLVLAAHEHGYERLFPTINSTVVQQNYNSPPCPVYIVNGAAGNREGNERPSGNVPWSAFQSGAVGFSTFTIAGESSLSYSFFDANGTVIDAWSLTK